MSDTLIASKLCSLSFSILAEALKKFVGWSDITVIEGDERCAFITVVVEGCETRLCNKIEVGNSRCLIPCEFHQAKRLTLSSIRCLLSFVRRYTF